MSEKHKLPDSISGLDGSVSKEDLEKLHLADKATESKKVSDTPWDKNFDDDDDIGEDGRFSRVEKKKKQKGIKAMVVGLFAALILIMFAPVIKWALDSGDQPNSNENSTQIVAKVKKKHTATKPKKKIVKKATKKATKVKKATKKNKVKSENSLAKEKAAQQKAIEEKNKEIQAQQDQKAKEEAAKKEAETNEPQQEANTQSNDQGAYYTVNSGDNPFRIALNHGMSASELYRLNGLAPGATINPGMRLRVK